MVPEDFVAQVHRDRQRATEVACVIANVQMQRLRQRVRTDGGCAVKARKRKAPGGLRRARTKGAKRACVRRDPRPDKQLRDLLMPAVRASMSAAEASELLFAATATASFHDLWPCGPWSSAGECVAREGRLKWQWVCRTCDAKAGDSSRAVKLARTCCGPREWAVAPSKHEVVRMGVDTYACGKCGRKADAAHRKSLADSGCPVHQVTRNGVEWADGSRALADLLGRVAAFRRWAEPDPGVRETPEATGQERQEGEGAPLSAPPVAAASFLARYRSHLCARVSRKLVCGACYQVAQGGQLERFRHSQCSGNKDVHLMPPFLRDGLRRGGALGEGAAAVARIQLLREAVQGKAGGVQDIASPAGHRQRPLEAGANSQPGPLAREGDAEARRQLKRRRMCPSSSAAVEALRACPSGGVASLVAAWPPGGSQGPPDSQEFGSAARGSAVFLGSSIGRALQAGRVRQGTSVSFETGGGGTSSRVGR